VNQYLQGQVAYTSVVIAQVTALSARQTLSQLLLNRQSAAIALIQALGGGWHAPGDDETTPRRSNAHAGRVDTGFAEATARPGRRATRRYETRAACNIPLTQACSNQLGEAHVSGDIMRILVVEDDPVLCDGLSRSLRQAGYVVDTAQDGELADELLSVHSFDLVVLDLGLPGLHGLEVLRRLRRRPASAPVLILTARDAIEDRVAALDLGADDYLVKPFELAELEARVRALVRRAHRATTARITHGALTLDVAARRAFVGAEALELSAREVSLLEALLLDAGSVLSKDQLNDRLYGVGEEVGPNAIEVFVHRLRRKTESSGVVIRTIRGLGYVVEKPIVQSMASQSVAS